MRRFVTLLALALVAGLVAVSTARAITVTVDRTATLDRAAGTVTLTGTMTCPAWDIIDVQGTLSQNVGRYAMTRPFQMSWEWEWNPFVCTGEPQPWSLTVGAPAGGPRWYAGPAWLTIGFADYWDDPYSDQWYQSVNGTVMLHP